MPRLIDLSMNWLVQYATESTLFDPSLYSEIPSRLARLDGYLGKTSAAFVVCGRKPEDWASQLDPWRALHELLARVEAEFSGRLLIGPDDLARWKDDPRGLTWAVLVVDLTDDWIRTSEDLNRIPSLVKRGVRCVRIRTADLEGADLRLLKILSESTGPRVSLALDLPSENSARLGSILSWLSEETSRSERLIPIVTGRGPEAIGPENLGTLRALGGFLGLPVGHPCLASLDDLRRTIETSAEVPFQGRPGFEGLAIATDFLGLESTLPELDTADAIVKWLSRTFSSSHARALIEGNGRALIERLTTQKSV